MTSQGVQLSAGKIQGLKYETTYAVAQFPTKKDEDRWVVYDRGAQELGSLAGAAFMLFDGHGGKEAAEMCTKSLMPEISKLHAGAAANVQTAADGADKADNGAPDNREGLKAQIMDRNSWMGYMTNSAIEEGFHVLDVAVKKVSNSGTTATVLLLRDDPLDGTELSSADAAVLAKCAWVGDSRCARGDLGPKGYLVCEDISRDHRPEAVSELARLSHSTHGRIDVSSDYVVVEVAKPMANGVKTLLSVRGANGLETLDATFTKLKKELEPHGGFVVSVDTPGFPVESSVHGSRHSNRSPKSNSNLPGLLGSFSVHGTNQIGNLAGRNKARSSGNLVGMSRQPLGELKEILEGRKESFSKPVKEDDDSKGEGTSKSAGAAVESSGKVRPMHKVGSTSAIRHTGEDNAFFLGRLHSNGMTSQRRVFYPSGSSTAFTRSIGDRDAGGVIISKPEINSIEAPVQPGSRFIIASDGMWDVINTPDAFKIAKGLDARKAADKLATEACSKRRYGGFTMDDITVMVIDVMDNSFDSSTASRKDDISSGSGMSRPFSEAAEEAPKVSAGCFCFSSKANQ